MAREKNKAEQFPFREATRWLFWSAIVAPIPVWVLLFLLLVFSQVLTLSQFADQGEFAIYSGSIFASGLYLLARDEKTSVIRGRSILRTFCIFGLLAAVLFYAVIAASTLWKITTNLAFIRGFTLVLFGVAIFIGFLITYFDVVRSYYDPMAPLKDNRKKLEDDFKNSGGSR